MAGFQHRPMQNAKFSHITCLSCCSIHVGQLRWFADLLAAPLFFRHTNCHRINGRKQRDREQEIRFLRYRRAIELHHYAILGLHVMEVDEVPNDRHKVKSTSRVFGNGPVQTAPLLKFFWNDLGSSFKTPRNLGVSTQSFDGQLLENSSSSMRSQGPNDWVHARVINKKQVSLHVDTTTVWVHDQSCKCGSPICNKNVIW